MRTIISKGAKRSAVSLVGIVVMLVTVFAAGPSQAAVPSGEDRGVLAAPPATSVSQSIGPAVSSPGTSPFLNSTAHGGVYPIPCHEGEFCASVWDPKVGRFKHFFFYYCRLYALSNWLDVGYYTSHQTGGAVTTFYDRNMVPIEYVYNDGIMHDRNWDPVYYIRVC